MISPLFAVVDRPIDLHMYRRWLEMVQRESDEDQLTTAVAHVPLSDFGWSNFFESQISPHEAGRIPARIASVHRARLTAIGQSGPVQVVLAPHINTGGFAVGDWVLVDPQTHLLHRRLARETVVERHAPGSNALQVAAANVQSLFIVTSCNADFNPARLERYLALANEGGTTPVIVLTKADMIKDTRSYRDEAAALQRDLVVVTVNPRSVDAVAALAPWCGVGQTVAMVGSSGVGKSTLVNTLVGLNQESRQQTGEIREHDAKGRHTTTSRSLHALPGGGWVIDTPGMRTLHVGQALKGIETLFAEITELAPICKFRDCTHSHEPGCAVLAATENGSIDRNRLMRWRKLSEENLGNTPGRKVSGQSAPTGDRTKMR